MISTFARVSIDLKVDHPMTMILIIFTNATSNIMIDPSKDEIS